MVQAPDAMLSNPDHMACVSAGHQCFNTAGKNGTATAAAGFNENTTFTLRSPSSCACLLVYVNTHTSEDLFWAVDELV